MRKQLQVKVWKSTALPADWAKRTRTLNEALVEDVKVIVNRVAKNGDTALIEFTEKFDKAKLNAGNLQVTKEEIQAAYRKVSEKQIAALKLMKSKVSSFEKLIKCQRKIY